MISARQILQADLLQGLPFLLLLASIMFMPVWSVKAQTPILTFQEIASTCIDLANYDEKTKTLTVRFVNRDSERFYRYSKVPVRVWKKILDLDQTGGVGTYFTETVVRHSETYLFERVIIPSFKVAPKKKTAKDSK